MLLESHKGMQIWVQPDFRRIELYYKDPKNEFPTPSKCSMLVLTDEMIPDNLYVKDLATDSEVKNGEFKRTIPLDGFNLTFYNESTLNIYFKELLKIKGVTKRFLDKFPELEV